MNILSEQRCPTGNGQNMDKYFVTSFSPDQMKTLTSTLELVKKPSPSPSKPLSAVSLSNLFNLLSRGKGWNSGTSYDFEYLRKILKTIIPKWAIPLPTIFISKFNRWLMSGGLEQNYWLVHYYTQRIIPFREELGFLEPSTRSGNVMSAGLFCFVGQLLLYYCQFGIWDNEVPNRFPDANLWGKDFIDSAFYFSMLYIYVDYFLDQVPKTIENREKRKEIIQKMIVLLHDPYVEEPPEKMKGLVFCYKQILERSPQSKEDMVNLFMVELEGVQYQKNPNLKREDYYNIAMRKGGLTGTAIESTFYKSGSQKPVNLSPSYQIASILQLIDDMIDVYEDIHDGTNTIATHDLKKYGNMDILFAQTAIGIYQIPEQYWPFRFILMEALCYSLGQGDRFSQVLVDDHYNSIHLNWGKGNLPMEALENWLCHLITNWDTINNSGVHLIRKF